jgi:hypothetical protein
MPPLSEIQERIAYQFSNIALLERAMTHKSYANEYRVSYHNERMEFLGDAVLNLAVSEYLMKACPDSTEGDLSKLRAANPPFPRSPARSGSAAISCLAGEKNRPAAETKIRSSPIASKRSLHPFTSTQARRRPLPSLSGSSKT